MNKMNKQDIFDLIDWDNVMKQPRTAGGHRDVMNNIFGKNGEVLTSYYEEEYQGSLAVSYIFQDGTLLLVTDSFGSCSGCDGWEDCGDDDAKNMIQSIVSSGREFHHIDEIIAFCENFSDEQHVADHYHYKCAVHMVDDLKKVKHPYLERQQLNEYFEEDIAVKKPVKLLKI